jgi:hypothetical protein
MQLAKCWPTQKNLSLLGHTRMAAPLTPIRERYSEDKDEPNADEAALLSPGHRPARPRASTLSGFSFQEARVLAIPFSQDADASKQREKVVTVVSGVALTVIASMHATEDQ